jgi:hypothetical protein
MAVAFFTAVNYRDRTVIDGGGPVPLPFLAAYRACSGNK